MISGWQLLWFRQRFVTAFNLHRLAIRRNTHERL